MHLVGAVYRLVALGSYFVEENVKLSELVTEPAFNLAPVSEAVVTACPPVARRALVVVVVHGHPSSPWESGDDDAETLERRRPPR